MYVQPHPLQCCSCFPKVSLIQKCVYAMLVGHLGASASLVLLDLLSHLTSLLLLLQRNVLRCVRHFQYIGWPDRGVPTSGSALLDLIGQVQRNQEANGSAGPVVVHCRYGPFPSPSLSLSMLAAVLQHYNVCVCVCPCCIQLWRIAYWCLLRCMYCNRACQTGRPCGHLPHSEDHAYAASINGPNTGKHLHNTCFLIVDGRCLLSDCVSLCMLEVTRTTFSVPLRLLINIITCPCRVFYYLTVLSEPYLYSLLYSLLCSSRGTCWCTAPL